MDELIYDMLYLVKCSIHEETPDVKRLDKMNFEKLHAMCRYHFLDVITGTALKKAGVRLPLEWQQTLSKAVRKSILFDVERANLLEFMEKNGIWYMTLKGVVLTEMYPAVGMRQMSDNDILVDLNYAKEVRDFMTEQGYHCALFGKGNHDVYWKEPIYNFELHRTLYGSGQNIAWDEYYRNIKDRLVKKAGSKYEYCFTDEDFYVYLISHMYKHYAGRGTGFRSLLDVYIYLEKKEERLDFTYIENECRILGIDEFEKVGRRLCRKIFARESMVENAQTQLADEEMEMLRCYMTSGVYGSMERGVRQSMERFQKETGSNSKFRYYLSRLFPVSDEYKECYPLFYKYKFFLPIFWMRRIVCIMSDKNKRKDAIKEFRIVKKIVE